MKKYLQCFHVSIFMTSLFLIAQLPIINAQSGFNCGDPIFYEGQTYNTTLIVSQCWMARNLNVGTMIDGASDQTDNDTIEKYCYNNETDSCDTYGGLYQWGEIMHYTNTSGTQGICPDGWHIPTHTEWRYATLHSGGGNLKEEGTTHWLSPNTGATNVTGFTGLPGGSIYNSLFTGRLFLDLHGILFCTCVQVVPLP